MFSTHAWSASIDSAVLLNVAALGDPSIRVAGNNISVPKDRRRLMLAYALGPNVTRARITSPSLQRYNHHEVTPLDVAATPSNPIPIIDLSQEEILLDVGEDLSAFGAENNAGASRVTIAMWLATDKPKPINGNVRTWRFTNASTLVANAWTNGALTATETLPAGTYDLVGMRYEGANAQLARVVFTDGGPRPGVIGRTTAAMKDEPIFRMGNLGVWGSFTHDNFPTVDFLANGADTSQVVLFDLLRRG